MKKNVLRELLNAGKPTLSTAMLTTSPAIVEMIGYSGVFDFIELFGDCASWTVPDLDNFARAVELFPHMSSMMKVEREPRLFITHRSLGCGIQNLIFSDCDSAEDLEECIRCVRPATPQDGGLQGATQRRFVGYYIERGSEAWAQALRDVVIAVMIESKSAVEQLDEILSVKGLDMIYFGAGDYGVSLGKPGRQKSPETRKVKLHVIETAIKKGVRPNVIIDSYEEAKEYIDMGVRDFHISNELGTLYRWCRLNGGKIRELLPA